MKANEFTIVELKQDRKQPAKTRNPVAKNLSVTASGAGAHKDKKRDAKTGVEKHKKDYAMSEAKLGAGKVEESSPMIKPPRNRFDSKQEAFAYARENGGKVFKSTYTDPNTGRDSVAFVVKKDSGVDENKVTDFVRGQNYKRLARRSGDRATDALDAAIDSGSAADSDEFAKQQDQHDARKQRAKSLGAKFDEGNMSPQQQHDFDRMRYGAMSRKEYDAKYKQPRKSDAEVMHRKRKNTEEAYDGEPNEYHVLRHRSKRDIENEITVTRLWSKIKQFDSYQQAIQARDEMTAKHPGERFTVTTHKKPNVAEGQLHEASARDVILGLLDKFYADMKLPPRQGGHSGELDIESPGTRVWTRGDGTRYRKPGSIRATYFPDDKKQAAKAAANFWPWLLKQPGVKSIGQVSGEFGSDSMKDAVSYKGLYFSSSPGGVEFGSMSRITNQRSVWRQKKDEGAAEGYAGVDDTDTVGFSVNTETAYTAVMKRFGDVIDHDETTGIMYAPASVWPRIEMVAFDADGEGAVKDDGVAEEAAGVGIVTKQNATVDVPVGGEYMNVKKLFPKKKKPGVAEGLSPQQKQAHQANLDAAQREMDRREAEGEVMTGAKIDQKTYKIIKPKKGVAEGEQGIAELSSALMARYKKGASADATAADARGDYTHSNKRFSGVVKATKKQFANDAKDRK